MNTVNSYVRQAVVIGGIVLGLAVSGCGGQDGAGPGTPTPTPTSTEGTPTMSPSTPPPSSWVPKPTPTPTRKPAPTAATVRGEVEPGVEAGCLMLKSAGRMYQLVGGDRALLRPGRTVVVTGVVQPDLATTCQQGIPLVVREVTAA